jgi:hypothetical protein
MLVSHTAQFIFLKTLKTGGASVEIALQKLFLPQSRAKNQPVFEDETGIVGARGKSLPGTATNRRVSPHAYLPEAAAEPSRRACDR